MDAVSYSIASKQAQRIEKFIENPDSVSGVLTVPKVIAAGETITIPAGRVAVLPNVQVDGTLNISGEVFIPSGATFGDLEAQLALKADTSYVNNKYSGFKNKIINGNFDIWQRGTNFPNTPNTAYVADRWRLGVAGSTPTQLYKGGAVFSSGVNSIAIDGKAGNTILELRQFIESINCREFTGGQKVTISFEVFTNAGFNAKTLSCNLSRAGGLDTWGTEYETQNQNWTLPSGSYSTKKSVTFTLPSSYFQWGTCLNLVLPTGLGAGETIAFGNVQLETGSVATPFEQRPYGLELSLCQRYYEVLGCGIGQVKDASSMILHFSSSEKRVPATAILLNTSPYAESPINIIARNGVSSTIATQMNQNTSKSSGHIVLITGFSSMTAGQSASINAGVIALSAEL